MSPLSHVLLKTAGIHMLLLNLSVSYPSLSLSHYMLLYWTVDQYNNVYKEVVEKECRQLARANYLTDNDDISVVFFGPITSPKVSRH